MPTLEQTFALSQDKGGGQAGQQSVQAAPPAARDQDGMPRALWANSPTQKKFRQPDYLVMVETGFSTGTFRIINHLAFDGVVQRLDGGDTTATISADLDFADLPYGVQPAPGGIGQRHFSQYLQDITTDTRVIIRQLQEPGNILFDGFPTVRRIATSRAGLRISWDCRSRADMDLERFADSQIHGQWLRTTPLEDWDPDAWDLQHVAALPLHFNPDGRPNRLALPINESIVIDGAGFDVTVYPFDSRGAPGQHDPDTAAQMWTLSQALAYLVFFYTGSQHVDWQKFWLDVNPMQSTDHSHTDQDQFRRRMTAPVDDVRIDAVNLREAIVLLCAQGGLHFDTPIERIPGQGTPTDPSAADTDFLHSARFWPISDMGFGLTGFNMQRGEDFDWPIDAPWTDRSGTPPAQTAQANPAESYSYSQDHRAIKRLTVLDSGKLYELTLNLRPGAVPFLAENASYYPGVEIPDGPVLDNVTTISDAVKAYWRQLTHPVIDPETREAVLSIHNESHPDHHLVADLFRLWVFPSDTRRLGDNPSFTRQNPMLNGMPTGKRYDPYPALGGEGGVAKSVFAHDDPLGCDLGPAVNWAPLIRPLGYPISQQKDGGTMAPILEMKFQEDDDWQKIEIPKDLLENECGIRLTMPNPAEAYWPEWGQSPDQWRTKDVGAWAVEPGDFVPNKSFLNAYLNRTLQVRITATVWGDDRLITTATGSTSFQRPAYKVVDSGSRFQHRDRWSGNSRFRTVETEDVSFQSIDEQDRLEDWADDEADMASAEVSSGNPTVWWIEPTIKLGDRVTGLQGIGVTFPRPSEIVAVEYSHDPRRTRVHFTDTRADAHIDARQDEE